VPSAVIGACYSLKRTESRVPPLEVSFRILTARVDVEAILYVRVEAGEPSFGRLRHDASPGNTLLKRRPRQHPGPSREERLS